MWSKLQKFVVTRPLMFIGLVVIGLAVFTFINIEALHYSSAPKFCATCHPLEKNGPLGEHFTWAKSNHATAGIGCLDCHGTPGFTGYMKAKMGGLKDLYGEIFLSSEHKLKILTQGASDPAYAAKLVPNGTCLHCHSDAVNASNQKDLLMNVGVSFRTLDGVKNPDFRKTYGLPDIFEGTLRSATDPNHKKHVWELGLSCVDCHLGIAHAGQLRNRSSMDICFTCHDARRQGDKKLSPPDNNDCQACHSVQKAVQAGTLLAGEEPQPWYMAAISCGDCHSDPMTPPTPATCNGCHPGKSYGGMIAELQSGYAEKLSPLKQLRDELFHKRGGFDAARTRRFNEFRQLVDALEKDGSKGVHNPEHIESVFAKAATLAAALRK